MNKDELKKVLKLHKLWLVGEPKGKRADLMGANLEDADLRSADLRGANLNNAHLRGADLSGANLSGANLRGANLRWANLKDADLKDADLKDADLSGANLNNANLRWANLRGAALRNADLSNAIFNFTKGTVSFTVGSYKAVAWLNKEGVIWINIGCQSHSKDHWLEHGKVIAEDHDYSEYTWNRYRKHIEVITAEDFE